MELVRIIQNALAISLTCAALLPTTVHAQSSYDKSIKSAQTIGPLDNNAFGDCPVTCLKCLI